MLCQNVSCWSQYNRIPAEPQEFVAMLLLLQTELFASQGRTVMYNRIMYSILHTSHHHNRHQHDLTSRFPGHSFIILMMFSVAIPYEIVGEHCIMNTNTLHTYRTTSSSWCCTGLGVFISIPPYLAPDMGHTNSTGASASSLPQHCSINNTVDVPTLSTAWYARKPPASNNHAMLLIENQ